MAGIKICGLKSLDDIAVANEIMPDYVGFVFALKKREIDEATAYLLRENLDSAIPAVGVFVNDSNERIISLLNRGIINIAQLHGDESERDIRLIQDKTGKPVIKAILPEKIRALSETLAPGENVFHLIEKSSADFLLYDSGMGSGKTFDWNLLNGASRPFFLAGGLTPDNIPEVLKFCNPYCLDISSGIEYEGIYKKDPNKMRAAVKAAREV